MVKIRLKAGKLYATSESECIVITYRRKDCHKHPKSMQVKLEIIIKKFMIFIPRGAYGDLQTIRPSTVTSVRDK